MNSSPSPKPQVDTDYSITTTAYARQHKSDTFDRLMRAHDELQAAISINEGNIAELMETNQILSQELEGVKSALHYLDQDTPRAATPTSYPSERVR